MKYYSETHEWIEMEDSTATVGVSNFAQKELGDIVYVELPKIGARVEAGSEAAVLESTKAAADVYSPLSGTIKEVNSSLNEQPELVNSDPENRGWLFKLDIENSGEIEALMEESAYYAKNR